MEHNRRQFLKFLGAAAAAPALAASQAEKLPNLAPSLEDKVRLVEGLSYRMLMALEDPINAKGDLFGCDNDYLACIPNGKDKAILWVNHESLTTVIISGKLRHQPRSAAQIAYERSMVGGCLLQLERKKGQWQVVPNHEHNRRITADTPIPIIAEHDIEGGKMAKGTLGNCAGGVTPWNTVLTCEENYHKFYGEVSFKNGKRKVSKSAFGWERNDPRPPEHYGWVVEVDPKTGAAKKLTGLGRFAHEAATCRNASDNRCVAYSGDDTAGECFYKFIADKPGSLETGTLYVADLGAGKWLPLTMENPKLKGRFKNQTDLLIRTREAAKLAGGTPLDRPEDIEVHPITGDVYLACTNNKAKGNYHGSILRFAETDNDPLSLTFKSDTFLAGGPKTGFSSPDNLIFDPKGNLWFTCDVSGSAIGKGPYKSFGNNGLYYVPVSGAQAGEVIRLGTAPIDAEFTGPCFSPDGETLFVSVQHPGDRSKPGHYTSHWPDGGETRPRSAVIAITGPLLKRLRG